LRKRRCLRGSWVPEPQAALIREQLGLGRTSPGNWDWDAQIRDTWGTRWILGPRALDRTNPGHLGLGRTNPGHLGLGRTNPGHPSVGVGQSVCLSAFLLIC
jgi:hypothetical protein